MLEGDWPVPLGIPLHLQLHKLRHDVKWAVHNHPLYGTVWADMGEVPPILDQSSALGGGELVLVDEYDGPVNDPNSARRAVEAMNGADLALLAGHGVFVLGGSARAVHQRAVALEQRCQRAWHVRAAGVDAKSPLPEAYLTAMRAPTARASSASGKRWSARSSATTRPCSTDRSTAAMVRNMLTTAREQRFYVQRDLERASARPGSGGCGRRSRADPSTTPGLRARAPSRGRGW